MKKLVNSSSAQTAPVKYMIAIYDGNEFLGYAGLSDGRVYATKHIGPAKSYKTSSSATTALNKYMRNMLVCYFDEDSNVLYKYVSEPTRDDHRPFDSISMEVVEVDMSPAELHDMSVPVGKSSYVIGLFDNGDLVGYLKTYRSTRGSIIIEITSDVDEAKSYSSSTSARRAKGQYPIYYSSLLKVDNEVVDVKSGLYWGVIGV